MVGKVETIGQRKEQMRPNLHLSSRVLSIERNHYLYTGKIDDLQLVANPWGQIDHIIKLITNESTADQNNICHNSSFSTQILKT